MGTEFLTRPGTYFFPTASVIRVVVLTPNCGLCTGATLQVILTMSGWTPCGCAGFVSATGSINGTYCLSFYSDITGHGWMSTGNAGCTVTEHSNSDCTGTLLETFSTFFVQVACCDDQSFANSYIVTFRSNDGATNGPSLFCGADGATGGTCLSFSTGNTGYTEFGCFGGGQRNVNACFQVFGMVGNGGTAVVTSGTC